MVFNSSVAGSDVEIIVPAVSTGLGAKCKTKNSPLPFNAEILEIPTPFRL